jgi:drug/metabolite transporter (DMT)-like permease
VKAGVALATPGLFLLCTNGSLSLNMGDLLATICAICVSLHLLLPGLFARKCDVFWLTAIQLGTVALLSLTVTQATGQDPFRWHGEILWALVICAVFATVFAFLVQTSMQRILSPAHTALIFCLEPVFAALYAWWAASERLGLAGFAGAILILGGVVVSELPSLRSRDEALT